MSEPAETVVVLVSSKAEWRGVLGALPQAACQSSPYGDWFEIPLRALQSAPADAAAQVIFLHSGVGKIAAASSTEYAIQRWQPDLVINLGTCGGLVGRAQVGEILLVEETLVYDIIERMGDPQAALDLYTTRLEMGWLPPTLPQAVRRSRLVSADRDILPEDIPMLVERFSGKDRTGLISALLLGAAGVPAETIAGDYAFTNSHLEQRRQAILDEPSWDAAERRYHEVLTTALPETMLHVLQYLEKHYGGVTGYLETTPLKKAEVDALLERFVDQSASRS